MANPGDFDHWEPKNDPPVPAAKVPLPHIAVAEPTDAALHVSQCKRGDGVVVWHNRPPYWRHDNGEAECWKDG